MVAASQTYADLISESANEKAICHTDSESAVAHEKNSSFPSVQSLQLFAH
jgi:hypothetical protein